MIYKDFLTTKSMDKLDTGIQVADQDICGTLYPFQRDIVTWACAKGKAAVFADCGLGKTFMQIEWARLIQERTGSDVLILAPLAVNQQTVMEGHKIDVPLHPVRSQDQVQTGINIANYEMLDHFDPAAFGAIVLDESSILKHFGSVYRDKLTTFAQDIPYRLCCTATPAPNDYIELINHAEFLSIMKGKEMVALFFTTDGNTTHSWRLKRHAEDDFWLWVASWAVALRAPSDLGYEDGGFLLPPIQWRDVKVLSDAKDGFLFPVEAQTLNEQRAAQRDSFPRRQEEILKLVDNSEQWLIWCNYNYESTQLSRAIPDAVEVCGSDKLEDKESRMLAFSRGDARVMVTKPKIAGHGMNWQQCHNMIFASLSHSYEAFYQATRRCWRFGQQKLVNIYTMTSDAERAIVQNIRKKEHKVQAMMGAIIKQIASRNFHSTRKEQAVYHVEKEEGQDWQMYCGDSIEVMDEIPDESVGLSIFSPPFPGMYVYTNSDRDLGNSTNIDEMMEHFQYLIAPDKLQRVMMPGRLCCVHLVQLPTFKYLSGYVGLQDFRGRTIQMMIDNGWIYAGEVCIDKDPQIKAIRTKDRGLLFKSLATDASVMTQALGDYLIYFRKHGDNPTPIKAGQSEQYDNPKGWITSEEWIEWAAPVWYRQTKDYPGGIRETDVLNTKAAKGKDDERHICPLQLGVIHRAVYLWSAPGEVVFSPFAGIGSEGYQALLDNRRFVGIELKPEYYRVAIKNMGQALQERQRGELFAVETA